jgi:hypothetical protein
MDWDQPSSSMELAAPLNPVARVLQLTDEIGKLMASFVRSPDLGSMIDEAAELMKRISSLDRSPQQDRDSQRMPGPLASDR